MFIRLSLFFVLFSLHAHAASSQQPCSSSDDTAGALRDASHLIGIKTKGLYALESCLADRYAVFTVALNSESEPGLTQEQLTEIARTKQESVVERGERLIDDDASFSLMTGKYIFGDKVVAPLLLSLSFNAHRVYISAETDSEKAVYANSKTNELSNTLTVVRLFKKGYGLSDSALENLPERELAALAHIFSEIEMEGEKPKDVIVINRLQLLKELGLEAEAHIRTDRSGKVFAGGHISHASSGNKCVVS